MIAANDFLSLCAKYGFKFFTGTPCSYLKPFINYVIDDPDYTFVDSVNEGDAVAIAAGSAVAGNKSVVMFQNSGLGNAVNPLTSLTYTFKIPILIITTLRGEPGGAKDEPQHELMGQITTDLLDTMRLRWEYFPNTVEQIEPALKRANDYMEQESLPFVFVMRKGDVEEHALNSKSTEAPIKNNIVHQDDFSRIASTRATRTEALRTIQNMTDNKTLLVATTGMTGRELYELGDHANQLYMVGSMGCALAFGIGLAMNKPAAKVVVLDGDGALLMRTGSMATVGHYRPDNLVHILLDNEVHDSTGGQATVSPNISFAAIAKAFGYPRAFSTDDISELSNLLNMAIGQKAGPVFVHFKMQKGSPKDMGRPKVSPQEVGKRFKDFIEKI